MKRQLTLLLMMLSLHGWAESIPERLFVSKNQRYLADKNDQPFFYLADTAWELFHRLTREEADEYLQNRAKKGFTVIQAVALAEHDGLNTPNAYGHLPFQDADPTRPALRPGDNNDYWDHVDYIVKRANKLGLYVALLPTWGRYWHDGDQPLFNPTNARIYGQWIAQRYSKDKIIWILGGDRNPENNLHRNTIRAMAEGIRQGDHHQHLITYHPGGAWGSANFFHQEEWLDFNLRQNGHNTWYEIYHKTWDDYCRQPAKPVIDGEPIYEGHPVAFDAGRRGHSLAADCRRAFYWDLFNGACGHTYGHHSVWQMWNPEKKVAPINNRVMSWREAIQQPGAIQMKYGRQLLMSRTFERRLPATEKVLIPIYNIPSAWPGQGIYRFVAQCDSEGTWLMVYAPVGRKFRVNTSVIKSEKLRAWWFNPRTGTSTHIGKFANQGQQDFISPHPGEETDWILVIDDAKKGYPRP